MQIKFKNLILGINSQRPFIDNFIINKNGWTLFSINSHIRQDDKQLKMSYKSFEEAEKSAKHMENKYSKKFNIYKCIYCNGWHIGKDPYKNIN